jgi:ribosomal protein S18 acetylase RimI-like enzyme
MNDVMAASPPSIRPATPQDAAALAELVNFAGEGLPLYVWAEIAKDGEDPWAVGRARAARAQGSFSYRNASVIEQDGALAAALIGYLLPDVPEAIDANMPAMFVPLQELENLAPSTWYVNVLASYPQWRRRGLGAALLAHAETLAEVASTKKGMSVIVADNNVGARRLYERMGYRERAKRPMVKESWQGSGSAWVLLVKEPDADAPNA